MRTRDRRTGAPPQTAVVERDQRGVAGAAVAGQCAALTERNRLVAIPDIVDGERFRKNPQAARGIDRAIRRRRARCWRRRKTGHVFGPRVGAVEDPRVLLHLVDEAVAEANLQVRRRRRIVLVAARSPAVVCGVGILRRDRHVVAVARVVDDLDARHAHPGNRIERVPARLRRVAAGVARRDGADQPELVAGLQPVGEHRRDVPRIDDDLCRAGPEIVGERERRGDQRRNRRENDPQNAEKTADPRPSVVGLCSFALRSGDRVSAAGGGTVAYASIACH